MAQGIFGGGTCYDEQSYKDIIEDIQYWVEYTIKTKDFFIQSKNILSDAKYWNRIPYNFRMILISSITQQNANLDDFQIIIKSIQNDTITDRDIKLLHKIGKMAIQFNNEYGRVYNEEERWKDYGDSLFGIAENMYAKGRDYFVTLQDAANSSYRLNDYIQTMPQVTQHNLTQNISGNNNQVAGVNSGNMIENTINNDTIIRDIESAISKINEITDVEKSHKEYINNILAETSLALENNDVQKQNTCKTNLTGFLIGAGSKAVKVIGILSSFASIASFFGFTL